MAEPDGVIGVDLTKRPNDLKRSPEPVAPSLAEGKTAEWWMNKTMYWKEQFDAVVRQRDHALAILKARDAEIAALASHAPASAPSEERDFEKALFGVGRALHIAMEAFDNAMNHAAALRGASPRPSEP